MCRISPCPLLTEVKRRLPQTDSTALFDMAGPSPPSLFVGRYGYPNVRVGPSVSWLHGEEDQMPSNGDPAELFGKPLEEVAVRHANLVTGSSRMATNATGETNQILEATQIIAMSCGAVEVELDFNRPVPIGGPPSFDTMSTPLGPSGDLASVDVVGHASISRKVESVANETDLLANEAMEELKSSGIGEAHISRILSSGLLGKEGKRKLVPTRWGITATDDSLSKQYWSRVRDLPSLDKYLVFEATYLDNRFHIILAPGIWAFQMLEAWCGGSVWGSTENVLDDWEETKPKSEYASSITGAYYAARLAVLEHMEARGRSGSCMVWRDIGPGYWAPVGVWLIRETVRNAMKSKPTVFDTLKEAVSYVASRVSSPEQAKRSWFANRGRQTTLEAF